MGAPDTGMHAAEQPTAETLLTAFRTIKAAERAKHAVVLDYWLSIRGDKEFPPLHDLDPLEISDAGPCSILLELIGGGQDAEIRHLGEALKADITVDRIIDAPNPSILSCIAKKLPIVAISRDFLAFEDNFKSGDGLTRCWVTLLPLSSCGSWVDYVYAFVSIETTGGKAAKAPEVNEAADVAPEGAPADAVAADTVEEAAEEVVAEEAEVAADAPVDEPETAKDVVPFAVEEPEVASVEEIELVEAVEPVEAVEAGREPGPEPEELAEAPAAKSGPGFSKLLEGFANLTGFYGQGVKVEDPVVQVELPASEPQAAVPEVVETEAVEPEALEPPAMEQTAVEAPAFEPEAVETPLELEEPGPAPEPVVESVAPESAESEQPVDEPPEDVAAEEAAPEPAPALEGSLQNKLTEVQAKADEAREAQLRATQALHEGLSAAYDFALEAEASPEEYLRMVEAQGLKIQLRAPMAPVAKLAFDGVCDSATIRQFEAVLAWALKVELPRGSLLERIKAAGGIPELLSEFSRAA